MTAELNFQKLFESLPGLFVVLKPDYTILAASEDYAKVVQSDLSKIIGRKITELLPHNPNDPNNDAMKEVVSSIEKVIHTKTIDKQIRRHDLPNPNATHGTYDVRYWSSINTPVLDSKGEVDYIIRRVEDVSSLIETQDEQRIILQERDMFFRYSFDLLAVVGRDGYFKRINPAFERTLGYTEAELFSEPVTSFLHPEDIKKTKGGIETLAAGKPRIASVNRYRCKDGSYKSFSWNSIPMGDVFYTVGRDITEQLKNEERIQQLNNSLEKKNLNLEKEVGERSTQLKKSEAQVQQLQKMDAIGRLAGGIAHDFNNMLAAVTLYCDLLEANSANPKSVLDNTKYIKEASIRATSLTGQLLIFSRNQVVQHKPVNLNSLIQKLEKMLTRLLNVNIKIITKFGENLKLVSADAGQIDQVILNLVVNARDAISGSGIITIETANVYLDETFCSTHLSVTPGNYVMLSVTDTGSGMDAQTVDKIFEPFFTTKPVGKGTGLGLSTTYGIITQSKGTIWVYSEPGKGSIFKIYLPVTEKVEEKSEAGQTSINKIDGVETILLVEDDEDLREGFSLVLESKGYKMLVAANGDEAVKISKNHKEPIHLLLTDMIMPGMNGVEVAKEISAVRSDIRVLYMSGYTSDVLENTGRELQPHEFIQKPFGVTALLSKLQEVFNYAEPE